MLLPGLGAKSLLFQPQRNAFEDLIIPDWPAPQPHETLRTCAQRWAMSLTPRRPLFIGGVSFGGMVALELARSLNANGVFLIASCRDSRYVNPAYRLLGAMARFFPMDLERWLIREIGGDGLAWLQELNQAEAALIRRVACDVDMPLLRWGGHQMLRWRFTEPLPCPVYQIHGARDDIIYPQPQQTDLLILDAKHLIHITHAAKVNQFIRERMACVKAMNHTPSNRQSSQMV